MRLRVRERAEAVAEFDSAVRWYAERDSSLAVQFVDAVEAAIAQILDWPGSGRPYPGREGRTPVLRTLRVKGFPYRIVYLVDGADLIVFAYPHGRRNPGYWEHRLHL